jgi:gamma-glutamyltranspeptidase/glutathione hydrolase/leukotriene-C4 hydrolase
MTHSDLRSYKVKVERALEGSYRGKKVYTSHAPTSGPAFLHMLNLMEKFGNASLEEGRTSLNAHRTIEVMKCESSRP